jgi:cytochrome c556
MRLIPLAAGLATLIAVTAPALADETKPEDLLKMRQGLFQAVKATYVPIVMLAKQDGKPTDVTTQQAENLAALAKVLPIAFAAGTDALPGSKTKAEAFTSADFAKGAAAMADESAKLAAAVKAGDAAAMKAQVGAVGKTCKACHENFRKE